MSDVTKRSLRPTTYEYWIINSPILFLAFFDYQKYKNKNIGNNYLINNYYYKSPSWSNVDIGIFGS